VRVVIGGERNAGGEQEGLRRSRAETMPFPHTETASGRLTTGRQFWDPGFGISISVSSWSPPARDPSIVHQVRVRAGADPGEDAGTGQQRYKHDYESGKVGKTVYSRSGRNMPPHRPRKIFNREQVMELRRPGLSIRQIAQRLRLGLGTVARTLQELSKNS
jgi:hypothetical protein